MDRSATRRRILVRGGLSLAGVASLSGCIEEIGEEFPPNTKTPASELTPELPVTEKTDVMEDGITALDGEEIDDPEAFRSVIEEYGIEVEHVEEEVGALTIEFISSRRVEEGKLHGIGPIAGAYAALIDSGYEAEFLEITILDPESSSFGAAEIDTELTRRYNAGELTVKEYGELVAGTIESKRHPPDVGATPDT